MGPGDGGVVGEGEEEPERGEGAFVAGGKGMRRVRRRNQSHPLARDDGAVNNDGHQKAKRNWFYYGRKDP